MIKKKQEANERSIDYSIRVSFKNITTTTTDS